MTFKATLKQHWKWFTAAGLVVLVAVAVGVAALLGVFTPKHDEAGQPHHVTTAESSEAEPDPAPAPVPEKKSTGVNIKNVGSMAYSPVWDPPDAGEGFWQIVDPDNGYPKDGGTDYVLAHSCHDRDCAGNQIRTLKSGDSLTFLGDKYVVENKLEVDKSQIADQNIWEHDPNRLVVITCVFEDGSSVAEDNDIVIAERAN
jgi:hypothetical protein